jgi:hypothetical protein
VDEDASLTHDLIANVIASPEITLSLGNGFFLRSSA